MKIAALCATFILAVCPSGHAAELNKKVGPVTAKVYDLHSGRDLSTCHRVSFTDTDGKKYVRDQDCPGHEGLGSIAYPADGCLTRAMCEGQTNAFKVYTDKHGVRKIMLFIKQKK